MNIVLKESNGKLYGIRQIPTKISVNVRRSKQMEETASTTESNQSLATPKTSTTTIEITRSYQTVGSQMISFNARGRVELLRGLEDQLRSVGVENEDTAQADLILLGASGLDEARLHLSAVPPEARHKVIVVGLEEKLEYDFVPKPGSFGALLENFQILGAMPLQMTTAWDAFGFVGTMQDARAMGLWFGGPAHSRNYAIWAGLADFADVTAFLVRLVEVKREPREDGAR